MRAAHGFTLIEITIVIAIIAIIAAAMMMTGNSVFGRSGTATLLANIHDVASASREFKKRYAYFPGDLPNAEKYLTGVSGGCRYGPTSPVGNGIVDTTTESNCALEHLVKAGTLRGIDYDSATSRYVIAVKAWGTNTQVSLGYDPDTKTNAVRVSNLPCDVALEIDRKLDPASSASPPAPFNEGSVKARGTPAPPPPPAPPSPEGSIPTCEPGKLYDPVPVLLIRY